MAEKVAQEFSMQKNLREVPKLEFGESDRGWVGDVAFTWLDGTKLESLGWKAKLESDAAVEKAVRQIVGQFVGQTVGEKLKT